jgi:hypothetical protein
MKGIVLQSKSSGASRLKHLPASAIVAMTISTNQKDNPDFRDPCHEATRVDQTETLTKP